jgi:hypothetical protein
MRYDEPIIRSFYRQATSARIRKESHCIKDGEQSGLDKWAPINSRSS